jgi:hypothetical protein
MPILMRFQHMGVGLKLIQYMEKLFLPAAAANCCKLLACFTVLRVSSTWHVEEAPLRAK